MLLVKLHLHSQNYTCGPLFKSTYIFAVNITFSLTTTWQQPQLATHTVNPAEVCTTRAEEHLVWFDSSEASGEKQAPKQMPACIVVPAVADSLVEDHIEIVPLDLPGQFSGCLVNWSY